MGYNIVFIEKFGEFEIVPFAWNATHYWAKGIISNFYYPFFPGFGLVTPFTGPSEKGVIYIMHNVYFNLFVYFV